MLKLDLPPFFLLSPSIHAASVRRSTFVALPRDRGPKQDPVSRSAGTRQQKLAGQAFTRLACSSFNRKRTRGAALAERAHVLQWLRADLPPVVGRLVETHLRSGENSVGPGAEHLGGTSFGPTGCGDRLSFGSSRFEQPARTLSPGMSFRPFAVGDRRGAR